MRKILALMFLFLLSYPLTAGVIEPVLWTGNKQQESVDISDYVYVYLDSVGIDVGSLSDDAFLPSSEVLTSLNAKKLQKYTIYYRLVISNETSDSLNLYISLPRADKIKLNTAVDEKIGGRLSLAYLRDERFVNNSFLINLLPKQNLPISGEFKYVSLRAKGFFKKFLLQEEVQARSDFFGRDSSAINYKYVLLSVGFFSSVFLFFVFILAQYTQTRDKLYLYYCFYLLTVLAYSFISLESILDVSFFDSGGYRDLSILKHPLGIFINIAYFYFINDFLDLKLRMPKLFKFFRLLIFGLYLYIIIGFFMQSIFDLFYLEYLTYFAVRFLWLLPSIYFLIVIWRKKIPYSRIVLIGTSMLLLGSIISLALSLWPVIEGFLGVPILYTELGILFEIVFFSIGIGRKTKDLEIERLANKEKLIKQLVKNEELQSDINLQLKKKVRLHEIEQEKNTLTIEKDRAELKTTQLEKELAEMELLALRSQMNPHFIFNSLNSIKSYILRNGPLEAAEYLTNFSNLMRSILYNSKHSQISIVDELETVLLYVKLEQIRFSEKFEFSYFNNVDESLSFVLVPPMILQPYVENAIWHGLLHLESNGRLKIEILEEEGCLKVIIEDNGIGRERSNRLRNISGTNHKSMGMGITQSRIDLHNQMNARGIKVEIFDASNEINCGTRVVVTIKCDN